MLMADMVREIGGSFLPNAGSHHRPAFPPGRQDFSSFLSWYLQWVGRGPGGRVGVR